MCIHVDLCISQRPRITTLLTNLKGHVKRKNKMFVSCMRDEQVSTGVHFS